MLQMVAVMKVALIGVFNVLMGCTVTKGRPKVCFNIRQLFLFYKKKMLVKLTSASH